MESFGFSKTDIKMISQLQFKAPDLTIPISSAHPCGDVQCGEVGLYIAGGLCTICLRSKMLHLRRQASKSEAL